MQRLSLVYPSRTKESRNTELLYSPLALAYIARHTPDDWRITIEDEYVGDDVDAKRHRADIVALSPITPGITRAYELADGLRKRGITVVAGGAHVSALPDEALEHVDAVVVGEGEVPWRELVRDFETGKLEQRYEGRMDAPLDDLGTPRRDLIHPGYKAPSLMTSRGCPYACSFCYLNAFPHRKYRTIPHDTVIEDLDSVKDSPTVIVTDENFMGYSDADVEDRKLLMERVIRREYGFIWGCQTTVRLAYERELMDLMYRAGCRAVFIGFEATDRKSLAEINKAQNQGVDYEDVIRRMHDAKLAVIASCIIGLDTQGPGYERELIDALRRTKADYPRVFFMTAWPGTPLFKKLEKEGRASRDWDSVRKDIPSVKFKNFTPEEILESRNRVMDWFFSPGNVSRVIARGLLRDRSLIAFFIEKAVRNRIVERVRRIRNANRLARLKEGLPWIAESGTGIRKTLARLRTGM